MFVFLITFLSVSSKFCLAQYYQPSNNQLLQIDHYDGTKILYRSLSSASEYQSQQYQQQKIAYQSSYQPLSLNYQSQNQYSINNQSEIPYSAVVLTLQELNQQYNHQNNQKVYSYHPVVYINQSGSNLSFQNSIKSEMNRKNEAKKKGKKKEVNLNELIASKLNKGRQVASFDYAVPCYDTNNRMLC
jgi:hypothetical protein